MSQVETILIQHPSGKGGVVLINKHDFDPAKHKLPGQKATKVLDDKLGSAADAPPVVTTSQGGEASQKETKELVLVLDDKLGSAAGLGRIMDENEFPVAKLNELAGLLLVEKGVMQSDKKYRQAVLGAATKLMI